MVGQIATYDLLDELNAKEYFLNSKKHVSNVYKC